MVANSILTEDIPIDYSPKEFRVWDTKLKLFFPWNCFVGFNNPEYIVQQLTGKVDRFGNKLYEGDIVSWGIAPNFPRPARIVFAYGMWCMKHKIDNQLPAWYDSFRESTLIGNICETPELLA